MSPHTFAETIGRETGTRIFAGEIQGRREFITQIEEVRLDAGVEVLITVIEIEIEIGIGKAIGDE